MSSPRRSSNRGRTTRGPLPPSVYWRRRVFVLGLAASLVFVIAGWLTGGSDGRDDDAPAAQQAGARVPATTTVTAGTTPSASATPGPKRRKGASPTPTLAVPEGRCDAADVLVTPSVRKGVAGRDVTITLSLQTVDSEACTWRVSPTSVTVKIADGKDEIWTTRHCRRAVSARDVVVRRAVATVVELTWNARESAAGCRRATNWIMPGDYTVAAAALGGEPAEANFTLASPTPETITTSPDPEPGGTAKPAKKKRRG